MMTRWLMLRQRSSTPVGLRQGGSWGLDAADAGSNQEQEMRRRRTMGRRYVD
jgi:hypothetical protein